MIKTRDAIATARALLGTPYKDLDCINLIKRVIRSAPGGVKNYTTAGTNALWDSYNASGKYRDLVWRQESTDDALAGMLAFKRRDADVHHVGIVTGEGTVIHSSSVAGKVVETALDGSWDLLGEHRYIGVAQEGEKEKEKEETSLAETAVVRTQRGKLNVRKAPGGEVIARLDNGSRVSVLAEADGWLHIAMTSGEEGYVSAAYIERATGGGQIRITDAQGHIFFPQGGFTVSLIGRD